MNKHVGGHCFLRSCYVTKPHWHCEHTLKEKRKDKHQNNQHEETQQSAAVCHSSVCGVSVWPLKMFAAFWSFCLHLSDSCRQASRAATKGSFSKSHQTTPGSNPSSSLERNQCAALAALRPLRFCLATVPEDSHVGKVMRCRKKKKAAGFAKNARCHHANTKRVELKRAGQSAAAGTLRSLHPKDAASVFTALLGVSFPTTGGRRGTLFSPSCARLMKHFNQVDAGTPF